MGGYHLRLLQVQNIGNNAILLPSSDPDLTEHGHRPRNWPNRDKANGYCQCPGQTYQFYRHILSAEFPKTLQSENL